MNSIEAEQGKRSRLQLPLGRDHLVLSGPLGAVAQIGDTDPPGLTWNVAADADEPARRPEPDPTDPFWRNAPSLIWPDTKLTAFSDKLNPVPGAEQG